MYAKLFTQIFDSSIADNWKHRHVFEDILKLADQEGIVDMTPEAIAARTRMPIEMVKAGIAHLESPDPRSRTKDQEGRRLVRLDPEREWGWLIVNYTKYREIKKQTDRKAYMADYMRKYRQKTAVNSQLAESVNYVNTSPSASSSVAVLPKGGMQGGKSVFEAMRSELAPESNGVALFEKFWNAYPLKEKRMMAESAFVTSGAIVEFEAVLAGLSRYKTSDSWCRDDGKFIQHPHNWLLEQRWKEEPRQSTKPKTKASNYVDQQIAEAMRAVEGI